MAGGDWIKVHRRLLNSAVMRDDWLCRLWIWCLLKTNYSDRVWPFGIIPAGSFVTGRLSAAESLGVNQSKWYRGMKTLAKLGQISLKPNNQFTIVTICNWETYQSGEDGERTTDEQRMNNERTTDEQRMNTTKERKNKRREENTLAAQGDAKPSPPEAKSRKPATGSHAEFIALFVAQWSANHGGEKYPFKGGKDGSAAAEILKTLGDDRKRWSDVLSRYFADRTDFFRGHPLAKLSMELARFLTDGKSNRPQQFDGIREFLAEGGDEQN